MNWAPVIKFGVAVVAAIVGLIVAGVGLVAGADPEGRGGNLLFLLPAGIVIFIGAAAWGLWQVFS